MSDVNGEEVVTIEFFLSDDMHEEVSRLAALSKAKDPVARLSAKAISTAIMQGFKPLQNYVAQYINGELTGIKPLQESYAPSHSPP